MAQTVVASGCTLALSSPVTSMSLAEEGGGVSLLKDCLKGRGGGGHLGWGTPGVGDIHMGLNQLVILIRAGRGINGITRPAAHPGRWV